MAVKDWTIWTFVASFFMKVQRKWRSFSHVPMSKALSKQFASCEEGFNIYRPHKISGLSKIKVGSNVHINSYAVIQGAGGLELGDNLHIGPNVTIYTTTHNYNGGALPYDHTVIKKPVIIRDNVWIGACVTIVPGVEIGEGAIIAAGTIVVKDVPELAMLGGNADQRIIKYRNKEHYDRLVSEQKYGGVGGKLFI